MTKSKKTIKTTKQNATFKYRKNTYLKYLFYMYRKAPLAWGAGIAFVSFFALIFLLVPLFSDIGPFNLWQNDMKTMVIYLIAILTSVHAVCIFRGPKDDGSDLLLSSKPISKTEMIVSKFVVYTVIVLFWNSLVLLILPFTFLFGEISVNNIGGVSTEMVSDVAIDIAIGSLINCMIWGSVAIMISVIAGKLVTIISTLSLAIILSTYHEIGNSTTYKPSEVLEDQNIEIELELIPIVDVNGDVVYKNTIIPNKIFTTEDFKDIWNDAVDNSSFYSFTNTDIFQGMRSLLSTSELIGSSNNVFSDFKDSEWIYTLTDHAIVGRDDMPLTFLTNYNEQGFEHVTIKTFSQPTKNDTVDSNLQEITFIKAENCISLLKQNFTFNQMFANNPLIPGAKEEVANAWDYMVGVVSNVNDVEKNSLFSYTIGSFIQTDLENGGSFFGNTYANYGELTENMNDLLLYTVQTYSAFVWYYSEVTLDLLDSINKPYWEIKTDDIKNALANNATTNNYYELSMEIENEINNHIKIYNSKAVLDGSVPANDSSHINQQWEIDSFGDHYFNSFEMFASQSYSFEQSRVRNTYVNLFVFFGISLVLSTFAVYVYSKGDIK